MLRNTNLILFIASSAKTAPQGQSPDKEKATAASTDGLKPTASQSEGKENAGGPAEDTTTDAENVLDTGDLEVELNTTLARLQDDENSPLFSVKNFSELGLYVRTSSAGVHFFRSSFSFFWCPRVEVIFC